MQLVDPGAFWYSGLATGMLGGSYEPGEDQVDPRRLIERHGGEFIEDRVVAMNPHARSARLAGGGQLEYDYVSINVGSRVDTDAIPGIADDPTVWSVKPISNLWRLRQHLEARFLAGDSPRVAVIGGGPSGCEVAANVTALAGRHGHKLYVTLITRDERLIAQAPPGAARALRRTLAQQGVVIRTHTAVVRRERQALLAADGSWIDADVVVLANGLETHPLISELGLPTHPQDGLRVAGTLQSIADRRIFAAGDCAALEGFALPRLGVFGVRQAACIHANLLASVTGKPLVHYQPQKRYLSILNLGRGTALATWGPFWWQGSSSMWLKDVIDRRFLDNYRSDARET